jgi:cytochrome P450
MDDGAQADAVVPGHVPQSLVRDFPIWWLPGYDRDPTQAVVEATRGLPEIFYGLRVGQNNTNQWVVTTYELSREVYQDAELFSSRDLTGMSALLGEDWPILPIEVDPPEHGLWRTLMNPVFSPTRMKAVEEDIRATAKTLVDRVLEKGETEFVADFSEVYPITIFLSLLGLPLDDTAQFLEWENGMLHSPDFDTRRESILAVRQYLLDVVRERRAAPKDDMVSYVANAKVEGRDVTDFEAQSLCFILFLAGLDTVTAALGFAFKHMAEHPEHQQQLRDEPALIPDAIEEFLRAYPLAVSSRLVTRDAEFHGVKMKKGDRVVISTQLAGRDERVFANPDHVDFRRENNSHITFAAGPHRCLGSHLARRELRIALEEWLSRVPPFRIRAGETPVTHAVGVFGVDYLPLVW